MTDAEVFELQMHGKYEEADSRDATCRIHWSEGAENRTYGTPVSLTVARILKRELTKRKLRTWIEVV